MGLIWSCVILSSSRRSHAVFTLILTCSQTAMDGMVGEKVSRVSLVDLAGVSASVVSCHSLRFVCNCRVNAL